MAELALTRSSGDKRRFELEGFGTLRLGGWASRWATAQAGARKWGLARRGILSPSSRPPSPTAPWSGSSRAARSSAAAGCAGRTHEYTLEPDSRWKEHYALVDGERRLAMLEGKGWGKRPVRVEIADDERIDPGLLLFAAFVVRALAEDASAAGTAVAGA